MAEWITNYCIDNEHKRVPYSLSPWIMAKPVHGGYKKKAFSSAMAMWNYIQKTDRESRIFHEFIIVDRRKFAVDIDGYDLPMNMRDYVIRFVKETLEYILELGALEFQIGDSSREGKVSVHMILQGYCFDADVTKWIIHQLQEKWPRELGPKTAVDGVFSLRKQLRMLGSKNSSGIHKRLLYLDETSDMVVLEPTYEDFCESLVSYTEGCEYIDVELPPEPVREQCVDGDLERLIGMAQELDPDGCQDIKFHSKDGAVFFKREADSIHPVCETEHHDNCVYVRFLTGGAGIMGCARCKKTKVLIPAPQKKTVELDDDCVEDLSWMDENKIDRLIPHIKPMDPVTEFEQFSPKFVNQQFCDFKLTKRISLIISPCGTGKTQLCERTRNEWGLRAVALTSRRSQAIKFASEFKFTNYLTTRKKLRLTHGSVVCSVESCYRLDFEEFYDPFILILDEAATIFSESISDTMTKHATESLQQFKWLISSATKIIAMDATFTRRDLDIFHYWTAYSKMDIFINTWRTSEPRTTVVYHDRYKWLHQLVEKFKAGENLVIPCATKKSANVYARILSEHCDPEQIKVYTSDTTKRTCIKKELADPDKFWFDCRAVIYTGTIDRAISFDIKNKFHTCFADYRYVTNLNAETAYQLTRRVRNLSTGQCHALIPEYTLVKPPVPLWIVASQIRHRYWLQENKISPFKGNINVTEGQYDYPNKDAYYMTWLRLMHSKLNNPSTFSFQFLKWMYFDGFVPRMAKEVNYEMELRTALDEAIIDHDSDRKAAAIELSKIIVDVGSWRDEDAKMQVLHNTYERWVDKQRSDQSIEIPPHLIIAKFYNIDITTVELSSSELIKMCKHPVISKWKALQRILGADAKYDFVNECDTFIQWMNNNDERWKVIKRNPVMLKAMIVRMLLRRLGFGSFINPLVVDCYETIKRDNIWIKNNYESIDTIFNKKRTSDVPAEWNHEYFTKWLNGKIGMFGLRLIWDSQRIQLGGERGREYYDYRISVDPVFVKLIKFDATLSSLFKVL